MAQKNCFVTIGATASFAALIKATLSAQFLEVLAKQGYTDLVIQYGEDGKQVYESCLQQSAATEKSGVKVSGFDLDKAGLGRYMRQARSGVVISHAGISSLWTLPQLHTYSYTETGSGSILDALRASAPLIVVPNSELLDNHQVELAEALAEQEYVVHGKLNALAQALEEAEGLRQRQKDWPPPNSGVQQKTEGIKGVLDEEMGYLD